MVHHSEYIDVPIPINYQPQTKMGSYSGNISCSIGPYIPYTPIYERRDLVRRIPLGAWLLWASVFF